MVHKQYSKGTEYKGDITESHLESSGVQARCSVRSVHDVISRFSGTKQKLVESIWFGGLLHFPPIKCTNRRFSAWLMNLVDVQNSSITLGDGNSISFTSTDISIVFGIPSQGRKVNEAGHLSRADKEKMKLRCWPLTGKEQRSIKAVQDLLDTEYPDGRTPEEEDGFKVAFVVYVMSTLFVPGAKHDYVCVDYWGALTDPSCIHSYDWADYIHTKLLASVSKFKSDSKSGCRYPNITGCDLFLQVFYLDNLALRTWSMDHNVRPRITCFTYERLRNMIAADTGVHHGTGSKDEFGMSKVRQSKESCYTWTYQRERKSNYEEEADQITLWEAAVNMAKFLRVPLESAGPLFLAVAEFNRRQGPGSPKHGIECINIMLNIMRPYVNGFRYNFGLANGENDTDSLTGMFNHRDRGYATMQENDGDINTGDCTSNTVQSYGTCDGNKSRKCVFEHTTNNGEVVCSHYRPSRKRNCVGTNETKAANMYIGNQCDDCKTIDGVDCAVIKAMSQFFLIVRRIKTHNRLELNTFSSEDPWQCAHKAMAVIQQRAARTPWELGGMWGYNSRATSILPGRSSNAGEASNQDMPYIVHYCPKYIEVMTSASIDQAMGLSEMEMDMFDAIMRSFMQEDDTIYRGEGRLRWRHFFESDILASVLAGWYDKDNPCIRNQFIGSHLKYDIYNCSILFFPVILHDRWVCFAWNLKKNKIVVFDPACINIPGFERCSIYTRVVDILKSVISYTIQSLFIGWDHDWSGATIMPFNWHFGGVHCWNRTGVLCAYFCRCFDGELMVPDIEMGQIGRVASHMFYGISRLQGNGRKEDSLIN